MQGEGGLRSVPPPTEAEIDHGVPPFLAQLADALRLGLASSPEIASSAVLHGHDLLLQGFTVSQVVHDYGDVCQAITELAVETSAPISTDDFRMLNGCLDDAIAGAVTQYGREGNQSVIDGETVRGSERLGFFIHELRNLINTAIVAFEVLKSGNVGVAGSTGTVLYRRLMGVRDLIGRSLAEVRLTQGVQNPKQFLVSGLIRRTRAGRKVGGRRRRHHTYRNASRGWSGDRSGPTSARCGGNESTAERLQVYPASNHRHAAGRRQCRTGPARDPG